MIPDILQYFVSGYVFVAIFKSICSVRADGTMQIIYSCIISFSLISCIRSINEAWLQLVFLNGMWGVVFTSIILAILISIICAKIYVSNWFRKLLVDNFNITPHLDVWNNIVDFNKGAAIKVYLRNKDFYLVGSLFSIEDKGNESWFCMRKYAKYDFDNKLVYAQSDNNAAHLVFNVKDIDYAEVFQGG